MGSYHVARARHYAIVLRADLQAFAVEVDWCQCVSEAEGRYVDGVGRGTVNTGSLFHVFEDDEVEQTKPGEFRLLHSDYLGPLSNDLY